MGEHDLELLAVTFMDIRSTVESMRRTVTNAQADIERLRHGLNAHDLEDLHRCVNSLSTEVGIVGESIGTVAAPHN